MPVTRQVKSSNKKPDLLQSLRRPIPLNEDLTVEIDECQPNEKSFAREMSPLKPNFSQPFATTIVITTLGCRREPKPEGTRVAIQFLDEDFVRPKTDKRLNRLMFPHQKKEPNMNKKPSPPRKTQRETAPETQQDERQSPEQEPAIERGERIATGKAIARGGRDSGFVPGAQPDAKNSNQTK